MYIENVVDAIDIVVIIVLVRIDNNNNILNIYFL